jgi:undecaprenyl-diphosphatase
VPILHAIVLGIVQGLSEFLPISSSGHLILVPELMHWTELTAHPDLNKTFDVALHLGTFLAAAVYFRRELVRYSAAGARSIRERAVRTVDERIAWLLLLSAIPGAVAGALFEKVIEDELGEPVLIGTMMIVFGLILYAADQLPARRVFQELQRRDAALTGLAQALALSPGVSRSGVTITTGRWLGFERDAAIRISFLMSLPITAGACLYKGAKLAAGSGIAPGMGPPFVWGILTSAVMGYIAIAFLLRLVRTHTFTPIVVYRVVLGVAVIVIFGTGLR